MTTDRTQPARSTALTLRSAPPAERRDGSAFAALLDAHSPAPREETPSRRSEAPPAPRDKAPIARDKAPVRPVAAERHLELVPSDTPVKPEEAVAPVAPEAAESAEPVVAEPVAAEPSPPIRQRPLPPPPRRPLLLPLPFPLPTRRPRSRRPRMLPPLPAAATPVAEVVAAARSRDRAGHRAAGSRERHADRDAGRAARTDRRSGDGRGPAPRRPPRPRLPRPPTPAPATARRISPQRRRHPRLPPLSPRPSPRRRCRTAGARRRRPRPPRRPPQPAAEPVARRSRAARDRRRSAPADAPAAAAAPTSPAAAESIAPPATQAPAGDAAAERTTPLHRAPAAVATLLQVAVDRGITHAKMTLRPAELGGIEIRLQSTAAGIAAQVVADSPEAARLLTQAGDDLRRALEARNVTLISLDVSTTADQQARQSARGEWADGDNSGRLQPAAARPATPTATPSPLRSSIP